MAQLLVFAGGVIVAVIALGLIIKLVGIVATFATWMLAGYLAGRLVRDTHYGPIDNIALGVVGSFIGSFVLGVLGLGYLGHLWTVGEIITGTVGAVILIYMLRWHQERHERGNAEVETTEIKDKQA